MRKVYRNMLRLMRQSDNVVSYEPKLRKGSYKETTSYMIMYDMPNRSDAKTRCWKKYRNTQHKQIK